MATLLRLDMPLVARLGQEVPATLAVVAMDLILERYLLADSIGTQLNEPRVPGVHEDDERRRCVVKELGETTDVRRLRHDEEILDRHAQGQHLAQAERVTREERDAARVRVACLPDNPLPLLRDPREVGRKLRRRARQAGFLELRVEEHPDPLALLSSVVCGVRMPKSGWSRRYTYADYDSRLGVG